MERKLIAVPAWESGKGFGMGAAQPPPSRRTSSLVKNTVRGKALTSTMASQGGEGGTGHLPEGQRHPSSLRSLQGKTVPLLTGSHKEAPSRRSVTGAHAGPGPLGGVEVLNHLSVPGCLPWLPGSLVPPLTTPTSWPTTSSVQIDQPCPWVRA